MVLEIQEGDCAAGLFPLEACLPSTPHLRVYS